MAHWTKQTEHAGAKNGGGFYGTRSEAKAASKVGRRQSDRGAIAEGLAETLSVRADATYAAADAAVIEDSTIAVEDLPVGDLLIVSVHDSWEQARIVRTTSAPKRAVQAFNIEVVDAMSHCDWVSVQVLKLDEHGDYVPAGRVARDWVGGRVTTEW